MIIKIFSLEKEIKKHNINSLNNGPVTHFTAVLFTKLNHGPGRRWVGAMGLGR